MTDHIVIVDHLKDWKKDYPALTVVEAHEYVGKPDYIKSRKLQIINLSRSYRYLSMGYYCSLLAEARHHKIIPTVRTITDLSKKSIYSLNTEDLDSMLHKRMSSNPQTKDLKSYSIDIFFGQCKIPELKSIARQIFDLFRCPLLEVQFKFTTRWTISSIKAAHINDIKKETRDFFVESLNAYLSTRWKNPKVRSFAKYDLAVLHNKDEKLPPSSSGAFKKLEKVGKGLGVNVELIEKKDYSKLAEYDALFIRETTQIDHHTYRFAKKAESEGMPVIDDPDSIVRCTNKVYLAELLKANSVPTPITRILQKSSDTESLLREDTQYPVVLKIPDGSFSRGVFKAQDAKEKQEICHKLFQSSDLILEQEFLYTEFDWRIGILNRQPLFACQYFMSKQHWQIVKHSDSGRFIQGGARTLPIEEVPSDVVTTALKAANLVGDGLYGVDLKQSEKGIYVIEVNDNPNIDAGVEDQVLGDELYKRLLEEFIRRIDM